MEMGGTRRESYRSEVDSKNNILERTIRKKKQGKTIDSMGRRRSKNRRSKLEPNITRPGTMDIFGGSLYPTRGSCRTDNFLNTKLL